MPLTQRRAQRSPRRSATRVAFVNQAGANAGGAERTLASFLRHRPSDLDPVVVLFEDGAFADEVRSLGIPVVIVPATSRIMSAKRERLRLSAALDLAGLALGLAHALRRERIDVIYTNSMKAHVAGSIAGRLARIPCVMHFHDLIGGAGLQVLRLAARFGSARRIACSQLVARTIGLGRTVAIYGPVETRDFAALPPRDVARAGLGLDPEVPAVALVGRINRWKGHDRLVRIAALVNAERPVQFLIVGSPIFRDADFLPELEAMVRDRALDDVVRFVPWVDDVRAVFAAIDVNVNCSTREPLGRTPAEAAAAGVPSVVFDDSGAAETLANGIAGRIVPAHDESRFAAAILELLREVAAEPHAVERIRASALRFDAERIAIEMSAVIRQVAAA